MTVTTTFRIDPKDFAYGVRMAKQAGARFDGATKTWSLPRAIHPDSYRVNRWVPVAVVETPVVETPAASALCPRCGTVCHGDCTAH